MPVAPLWICLLALGGAGCAIWLGHRSFRELGHFARRGAVATEVLAHAAVIPLAVWTFGR
jgi:hypothetical protein